VVSAVPDVPAVPAVPDVPDVPDVPVVPAVPLLPEPAAVSVLLFDLASAHSLASVLYTAAWSVSNAPALLFNASLPAAVDLLSPKFKPKSLPSASAWARNSFNLVPVNDAAALAASVARSACVVGSLYWLPKTCFNSALKLVNICCADVTTAGEMLVLVPLAAAEVVPSAAVAGVGLVVVGVVVVGVVVVGVVVVGVVVVGVAVGVATAGVVESLAGVETCGVCAVVTGAACRLCTDCDVRTELPLPVTVTSCVFCREPALLL
jgi:hypothetical protein